MRPREVRRLDESWTESSWGKPAYNQDSDCSPEPGCPVTWLVLNSRKHSLAAGLFTYQHQKSLFFFKIFKMWTIFKIFTEFVTILLLLLFLCVFVFWPRGVWDPNSLTRDWTCTSCIRKWSVSHWITMEVPRSHSCIIFFWDFNQRQGGRQGGRQDKKMKS